MPVLCTPDQFGTLRLPTPPVTERHVVGSHLSSLRSHRVTGRISDSDVEVRCNKQGIATDPSGGGRRRVVANFPSLDSLSRDRVVKSVASQSSALGTPEVFVISGAQSWGSKDFQSRDDRSLSGQRTASGAQFQSSNVESVVSSRVNDLVRKDTFLPSSGIVDTPFGHSYFSRDPIVSNPSVTFVSSMQSTPYYVSSNPHTYVGVGDVLTSTQSVFDHSHRREYMFHQVADLLFYLTVVMMMLI